METVEHWWNGSATRLGRRDVWLRRNPAGQWEVEQRRLQRSALDEFASETRARDVLGRLVAAGHWRRLDQPQTGTS